MSGIIAILIANIIWGAAPPIFKYSLEHIPPFTLGFIRFFTAGLLMWPFVFKYKKTLNWFELKNIILGGFWGISITVGFFFLGLQLAPSINVHIIGALSPIVLYFSSIFMLHEKPHPQVVKGMLISLLGASVVVLAPMLTAGNISSTSAGSYSKLLLGNAFFVLSMIGGVLIVIYTKKVSKTVHPLFITCIQFLVGALTFAPFMVYEMKSWSFSELTYSSWVGIIYGTVFSSAIAYIAHNYALTKLHAQQIGIYGYIMPVIAILIAIPLLHEYPDIYFIIGAIITAIGIYISSTHPHWKKVHKK